MDFLLLWLVGRLTARQLAWTRLLAGTIVGTLPTLLVLIEQNLYAVPLPLACIWPLVMAWVAFGGGIRRNLGQLLGAVYGITVGLAGVCTWIWSWGGQGWWGLPSFFWMVGLLPLVVIGVGRYLPLKPGHWAFLSQVPLEVRSQGNLLRLRLFWDTGNQMLDPVLHRPVVVVALGSVADWLPSPVLAWALAVLEGRPATIPEAKGARCSTVPYLTVQGQGTMPLVIVDRARVWMNGRWYGLGPIALGMSVGKVSPDDRYDALGSPHILRMGTGEGVGA